MDVIIVSAPHETKGAKLLFELSLSTQPFCNGMGKNCIPKKQRLFGAWGSTAFGSSCRGIILSGNLSQEVTLEIGTFNGIPIKEIPGGGFCLFSGAIERPEIQIGKDLTAEKFQKAVQQVAAHLLKGFPPTPAALKREKQRLIQQLNGA